MPFGQTLFNMIGVTFVLIFCVMEEVRGQTPQHLKNLVENVTLNYDKRFRPVEIQSLPVYLDVSLHLCSIIGTDEMSEILETSGYLAIIWRDAFLF